LVALLKKKTPLFAFAAREFFFIKMIPFQQLEVATNRKRSTGSALLTSVVPPQQSRS
jgi:hypothetical protein